ncbi:MAG: hypothetical protein JNL90_16760 [Planctomycetes bacterium]|nr:hypothetical protein [Planctomycetota bacterium]
MGRATELLAATLAAAGLLAAPARAQLLDKGRLLAEQRFWDNRDFDWYAAQIPFFECPDAELTTTWYYRFELLTKHLTYGSPNSGYCFTEFIDRPHWSGAYGAISCPAGHQLYEARWLHDSRYAHDYLRYWFRTPGAQPRSYSTWLADAAWAVAQVHPDDALFAELLPDLIDDWERWAARHFVPAIGLFWQTGHDDGMEFNINSRQTRDPMRGGPAFRPSFNAYRFADAVAIARFADRYGQADVAVRFRERAEALRANVQALLWDPRREFFFPMARDDEERDGQVVKAGTLTYQSGPFAGSPYGRELIGYVPWQFGLPERDAGFEVAWKKLMESDGFSAPFGPTTVERKDPLFLLEPSCCWWSGQSWPYATTQTLKGLALVLQERQQSAVTRADYAKLLSIYARSHRRDAVPYLAEALHPDSGSFEGHDKPGHSEHYFHSGFADLVITGFAGLMPIDARRVAVRPLAPEEFDWWALDDVAYAGRRLAIAWDRDGTRYGLGKGLHVLVDGERVAGAASLSPLEVELPVAARGASGAASSRAGAPLDVNFAVNNDGTWFPRLAASYTAPGSSLAKVNDGSYWYHVAPANRWSCAGSPNDHDTLEVDFGVERTLHTIRLYLLDDAAQPESPLRAPERIELAAWRDGAWRPLPLDAQATEELADPHGHRANTFRCAPTAVAKLRVTLHHAEGARSGLTELEAWGPAQLPLAPAPPPPGNLAGERFGAGFPHATASFTDRLGGSAAATIDGITRFEAHPANRWTCLESPHAQDWLEIDFGRAVVVGRVEVALVEAHGGIAPPADWTLEVDAGGGFEAVPLLHRDPPEPSAGRWNEARFPPVAARKLRLLFTHRDAARSGVTEVRAWSE